MKVKNLFVGSLLLSSMLFSGGKIVPSESIVEEIGTETWNSTASLYMWGAGISGKTALDGEIDITFSDIVENLDMGFMSTLRTQKEKWGVESDFVYMHLGNNIDDNQLLNEFSYKAWVITPSVTYQAVDTSALSLHILVGARYLYMKPTITTFHDISKETSGNLWDGIIGIKGIYNFSEKWFMPFHFDVGTGDTDITWQAFAGIGYKYENFDLIAGYRHLDWTFDNNSPGADLFNDLAISGPMLGAKFRF